MKRALAAIVGVGLISVVTYVSMLNPAATEFRLSSAWSLTWPLGALIIAAFVAGSIVVLTVVTIDAGRRAINSWRIERSRRRHRRIDEWEERGEQLVWQGDPQRGRALLQKAWQRRPDQAHPVLALAASYCDTGEIHRARGLLFDAATQQPTNPEVLFALAEIHRTAGEPAPRLDVLERLRALNPRAPRVLRALRQAYVESGRWTDAAGLQEALIAELRDVQQASREREYLTILRYQAAIALPEPTARVDALATLADSRGVGLPILVSLGDALVSSGRPDEASVVWERALRNTPRTVLVERLVSLAAGAKHRDRLRTLLRKLRPDSCDGDVVRLMTAELLLADGNVEAAARELDTVATAPDGVAWHHALWAEVHRRRGETEAALAAYARSGGAIRTYRCKGCERATADWVGRCPRCGGWDTYRSTSELGSR